MMPAAQAARVRETSRDQATVLSIELSRFDDADPSRDRAVPTRPCGAGPRHRAQSPQFRDERWVSFDA